MAWLQLLWLAAAALWLLLLPLLVSSNLLQQLQHPGVLLQDNCCRSY
jgi:hypothetical protein